MQFSNSLKYGFVGIKLFSFAYSDILMYDLDNYIDYNVNATKLYLYFGRFAGDAILCSNFK